MKEKVRSISMEDIDELQVVINRLFVVPFYEAYVLWHQGKEMMGQYDPASFLEGLNLLRDAYEKCLEALEVFHTPIRINYNFNSNF